MRAAIPTPQPAMGTMRILLASLALAMPAVLIAQVSMSIAIGSPPLPRYEHPAYPGDGYLWTASI